MATTRRVFLEVLGSGMAMSAIGTGCGSRFIDESTDPAGGTAEPAMGTGGGSADEGGGAPSSGASGNAPPAPSAGSGGGSVGSGGTMVLDAAAPLPAGQVVAGNASALSPGAVVALPGANFVIARDAGGVYAVSRVCTHQGCLVNLPGTGAVATFNCPCHGSQFDMNGAVLRGPAARPLPHFAVAIDGSGNIVVDTTTRVAAATRVPL